MMTRFILFMYSRVPALCVLTRTHMHYSYYNITTTRLSMADTSSAIEIEEYGLLQPETNPYISSTASSRSPSSISVHKPSSFSSVNDLYDTVTSSVSTSLTRDIAKGLYFNLTLFLLTFLTAMQDVTTVILLHGFASNYTGDIVRGTSNFGLLAMHKEVVSWIPNF